MAPKSEEAPCTFLHTAPVHMGCWVQAGDGDNPNPVLLHVLIFSSQQAWQDMQFWAWFIYEGTEAERG